MMLILMVYAWGQCRCHTLLQQRRIPIALILCCRLTVNSLPSLQTASRDDAYIIDRRVTGETAMSLVAVLYQSSPIITSTIDQFNKTRYPDSCASRHRNNIHCRSETVVAHRVILYQSKLRGRRYQSGYTVHDTRTRCTISQTSIYNYRRLSRQYNFRFLEHTVRCFLQSWGDTEGRIRV